MEVHDGRLYVMNPGHAWLSFPLFTGSVKVSTCCNDRNVMAGLDLSEQTCELYYTCSRAFLMTKTKVWVFFFCLTSTGFRVKCLLMMGLFLSSEYVWRTGSTVPIMLWVMQTGCSSELAVDVSWEPFFLAWSCLHFGESEAWTLRLHFSQLLFVTMNNDPVDLDMRL